MKQHENESIDRDRLERSNLYHIPADICRVSPEKEEQRREDARREEETGFSEVKERSEVDGFAIAVAVGPWVAGERAGTEEEGGRREWRGKGKGGVGFGE